MKLLFTTALLLSVACLTSACAHEQPGSVAAPVLNGLPPDGPFERATVAIVHGGVVDCSGTLIAPDWVLTAAHCVLDYSGVSISVRTGEVNAAGGQVVEEVEADNCYMHPAAYSRDVAACTEGVSSTPSTSCVDTNPDRMCVGVWDVALLHLVRPVTIAPHRTIAPPRLCIGTGGTVPVVARGFGDGSNCRLADGTPGPAWSCPRITGAATFPYPYEADVVPNGSARVTGGDSGGTLSAVADEGRGVIAAVNKHLNRMTASFDATPVWGEPTHDFLWSVLDPSGACAAGAPAGGCTFREPEPAGGSTCGDGHCTGRENDFSCAADCQPALTDSDRDGLPDIRDLCPSVALAPGAAQHADADGDLIGDECDLPGCDSPCVTDDPDGDGIFGTCDNCPTDANTDQADCDRDGQGDACEPFVDADEDGYDDTCVGGDNCPGLRNPDQANCNADAERWEGADPVGDACDPVPCGETVLERSGDPVYFGEVMRLDRVLVDARSTVRHDARTGLRFCPCAEADDDTSETHDECATLRDCAGDSDRYGMLEQRVGWRHVTMSWEGSHTVVENEVVARYGPISVTGWSHETIFFTEASGTWKLRGGDEARWERDFSEERYRDRPGVLWTHTPGADATERRLASHFWSGVINDRAQLSIPNLRVRALPPFPAACWECQGFFPRPFLAMEPDKLEPYLMTGLGAIEASSIAGEGVVLDRPDWETWVAASESDAALAGTRVRMVAIDQTKGFAGGDVLVEYEGRYELRLVPGTSGSGWNGQSSTMSSLTESSDAASRTDAEPIVLEEIAIVDRIPDPPAPRRGPVSRSASLAAAPAPSTLVAALSAQHERVWTFVDGTMQIVDLRTGWTKWVAYSEPVLAATYSRAHGALFVIDVNDGGNVRLVRIDPNGSVGEVLAKWTRKGNTTRFALAATPGGSLWLVASDESEKHYVAWIDVDSAPVAVRAVRSGDLAIAPGMARADAMGVSYVVLGAEGPEAAGHRAAEFEPSGLGIEECF